MKNGLNVKELCKLIRARRNRMLWMRSGSTQYVSDRAFMVRFSDEEVAENAMPREVLVTLFTVFAQLPKDGEALSLWFGESKRQPIPEAAAGLFNVKGLPGNAEVTNLLEVTNRKSRILYRVIRARIKEQEVFIRVDESYMSLVNNFEEFPPRVGGKMMPIAFGKDIIILPIRLAGTRVDDDVLDLLGERRGGSCL